MTAHTITIPAGHPYARFFPDLRLMTWHPQGELNDAGADCTVDFIESREKVAGIAFNRFVDMTGYSGIRLSLDHIVRLARRRHRAYRGAKVRTAFYALRLISIQIARMYEELMEGSRIEVRTFRDRALAAEWLGVPKDALLPPKSVK